MADIRKTFNFRAGVQVDDDVFIVRGEQVGIGTTIPTQSLDVRGNAKVVGILTAQNTDFSAGISTFGDVKIGTGISISASSGIITATTFSGDGSLLQNVPTSAWTQYNQLDDNGLSVVSVAKSTGNVGIATTGASSNNDLQIGSDPQDGFSKGVGIGSDGNIYASGIITATTFRGTLVGTVSTVISTQGNFSDHVSVGNTISIGGTVGLGSHVYFGDESKAIFGDSGDLEIGHSGNQNIIEDKGNGALILKTNGSAISLQRDTGATMLSAVPEQDVRLYFNGNQKFNTTDSGVDITGITTTDDLKVTGVSTFTGDVTFTGDNYDLQWDKSDDSLEFGDNTFAVFGGQGDLKIRHNATVSPNVSQISGSPLEIIADDFVLKSSTGDKSYLTTTVGGATTLFNDGNEKLRTTGFGVTIFNQLDTTNIVASGVITATTELNSPLIGVGTDIPANDIQVRKSGNAEIQVTSDTGIAGITVGRESGQDNTNNAEFRYGGGGGFPYSSAQSLDIINYGTGNFNYHLSANNAGATVGNFFWHKGSSNVRLMTLTNSGRLGIGLTEPTDELHVDGGATVVGALAVGGNINVTGSIIGNVQGTLTGNVSGTLAGNANATVGISTLNNLTVTGIATIANQRSANISIGDNPIVSNLFNVHISGTKQVFVNDVGQIGINTTTVLPGVGINAAATNFVVNAIGVGVTQFNNGSVNFSNAGLSTSRFMVPPKVTTSQRNSLVDLTSGAMIYNTSLNKLQVYNGSAWETITSS